MANAKKCDKCGKYYDWYQNKNEINSVVMANTDSKRHYVLVKLIEFCPECMEEFELFVKGYKKVEE